MRERVETFVAAESPMIDSVAVSAGRAASRAMTAPALAAASSGRGGALLDSFGRRIDHLRLSVTSECDLRCVYCRPAAKASEVIRGDALNEEQRVDLVRYLHQRFGLAQARITGGEPLVFDGLASLVGKIRRAVPAVTIAMTTNGRLLSRCAGELRRAGLDRLNVSLDSLDAEAYRRLTGGRLGDVLAGLDAAADAGFAPPKINAVVLRGFNDGEVTELAVWAMRRGSEIRFLEAMPIGPAGEANRRAFVSGGEVRSRLGERFTLTPLPSEVGQTAKRFRATDGATTGIVGTIAPVTESFCSDCRRVRVTADGRLFPCLLDHRSVDLRPAWGNGCLDEAVLEEHVLQAVGAKQIRGTVQPTPMIALGG